MVHVTLGKYTLKNYKGGDLSTKGVPHNYTLFYHGRQVGAIRGAIFDIQRIDVNPKGKGHFYFRCSLFLKFLENLLLDNSMPEIIR